MRKFKSVLLLTSLLLISNNLYATSDKFEIKLSDNEIKTEILRDYLTYHIRDRGPCPCPELRSSDNKRCGKRSAWSRNANKTVMCYKDDVTQDMIDDWKERFALYGPKEKTEPKTKRGVEIAGTVSEYLENYGANDEFDRNYNK